MYNQKSRALFVFLISIMVVAVAPSPVRAQQEKTLKVGVAGSAPFVMNVRQQTGISLEIWQAMSNLEDMDYNLVSYEDVPEALSALDSGKLDMVIGPVSITSERAEQFWFTQPYFMTSLSIMAKTVPPTIWQRVKPFFSMHFFYAVFVFLFILAIVGTLLWLAERDKNTEEFPLPPARGIANGMWCAIVTMSTTGYGDRSPKTLWGRIIAGSWMIISIVFATTMVAGIASTLTLSGFNTNIISKAEQLRNKKVAVIKDSPADDLVKKYRGTEVYVESVQQAYQYLKTGKVAAIVYDRAQLLYLNKIHEDQEVSVSVYEYVRQGYGFAVKPGSQILPKINEALLTLQESGRIAHILNEWIGVNNKP